MRSGNERCVTRDLSINWSPFTTISWRRTSWESRGQRHRDTKVSSNENGCTRKDKIRIIIKKCSFVILIVLCPSHPTDSSKGKCLWERRKHTTVSKSSARKKEEVREISSVKDAMKSVELSSDFFRPVIRRRSSVCRDVWRRTEFVVVELKEENEKI